MFWEILKASKGLPVDDPIAALWGQNMSGGWAVTELTGELPLAFLSDGSVLMNYRIYGTSDGAGVETDNMYNYQNRDPDNGYINNSYIRASGGLASNSNFEVSEYVPIEGDTTYYLYWRINTSTAPGYVFYNENKVRVGGGSYGERRGANITTPSNARFLRFSVLKNQYTPLIGLYMTQPDEPVPYGYQIPLSVTIGEQSTGCDIYIGDSKLGEYEYADYSEQKVYRKYVFPEPPSGAVMWGGVQRYWIDEEGRVNTVTRYVFPEGVEMRGVLIYRDGYLTEPLTAETENVHTFATTGETADVRVRDIGYGFYIRPFILADGVYNYYEEYHIYADDSKNVEPTDPPAPLPAISTYKGENTLSSTETVGSVTIRGRIKEST